MFFSGVRASLFTVQFLLFLGCDLVGTMFPPPHLLSTSLVQWFLTMSNKCHLRVSGILAFLLPLSYPQLGLHSSFPAIDFPLHTSWYGRILQYDEDYIGVELFWLVLCDPTLFAHSDVIGCCEIQGASRWRTLMVTCQNAFCSCSISLSLMELLR